MKNQKSKPQETIAKPNHISSHVVGSFDNSFADIFRKFRWEVIIIFLASILLYANTIGNEYALDDQLAIYDNKFVTQGISGIPDILTHDAFVGFFGERGARLITGGRYRPLSFITFALEWELSEKNPTLSHIINILLYGMLCVSLFIFLALLLNVDTIDIKNPWAIVRSIPFIATLIFAYHPLHTEVVANIKGRDEILCLLFSLLALIHFLRIDQKRIKDFVIIAFLFFLALMSKENAITFLFVLPLIAWFQNDWKKENHFVPSFTAMIIATVGFLLLRTKYTAVGLGGNTTEILNNPFVLADSSQKFGTIIYSYFRYFLLLIFPHPLTHDYYFNHIPYRRLSDPIVLGTIAALIGLVVYVFRQAKNKSLAIFGILFFLFTFSIVSNIVFTVGIIMNERFLFIPSVGFAILVAWGIQTLAQRISPKLAFLVLIGLIIPYKIKTMTRNLDWKNNTTLFGSDYTTSYNSAKVSTSLGGTILDQANAEKDGKIKRRLYDSSILVLKRAIDIYPQNGQTWLLYGNALFARDNDANAAISVYRKCLELRQGSYFDADYNLGVLFYNTRQYDSALVYIYKANEAQPDHKEAKLVLTKTLAKLGRTSEAIALGVESNDPASVSSLALDAKEANNFAEALELADKALLDNANDATANYVKGISMARYLNQLNESIPYLAKAVQLDKTHPNWMEDLAVAYGMTGRYQESTQILEQLVKIQPTAAAYANLATSYNKQGNLEKANYYIQKSRSIAK